LPQYRGAAPIQWAIINGEKKTGITTMLTVLKLDAGDMLLKEEIEIDDEITAGQLHDKMSLLGAELLLKTIKGVKEGTITPTPQMECDTCYAPR
ncbi:MAG TPA: methionyl-tRNA formyltransferase, partial [Clostridiales bacterium]|nr:methionyl-tRNA formyltransferase [Clostridiales bacterium]